MNKKTIMEVILDQGLMSFKQANEYENKHYDSKKQYVNAELNEIRHGFRSLMKKNLPRAYYQKYLLAEVMFQRHFTALYLNHKSILYHTLQNLYHSDLDASNKLLPDYLCSLNNNDNTIIKSDYGISVLTYNQSMKPNTDIRERAIQKLVPKTKMNDFVKNCLKLY